MEAIKTYETATKKLEIFIDSTPETPREWDNLSRCIFTGKYKSLGDKHDVKFDGNYNDRFDFIEKGEAKLRKQIKDIVICKAVHLYSHSGETISTGTHYPYMDKWDSGTIGFVIVTKEALRKEWSKKRVTKEMIEKADKTLECEIETLDQYIRGDIYGFKVTDKTGGEDDSCWGFYGLDMKTNGITDHVNDEELTALVLAD